MFREPLDTADIVRDWDFSPLGECKHDGLLEIWMCKSPGSRRGRSLGYLTFVIDNNFFVISSRLVGSPAIAVSAFSQKHADARTAPQVSNGMVGVLKVSGTVARMLVPRASDSMSSLPFSSCKRSRIPAKPTPVCAVSP